MHRPVAGGHFDPLLTVPEVAERLAVAPGTIRNWLSLKKLEYVKIGGRTRIRTSVVEAYIEAGTVNAVDRD